MPNLRRTFNILASGRRLRDADANPEGRMFRERTPGEERSAAGIRGTAEYTRGQAKAGVAGAAAGINAAAAMSAMGDREEGDLGGRAKETYQATLTPDELKFLGLRPGTKPRKVSLSEEDMDKLESYVSARSNGAQKSGGTPETEDEPVEKKKGGPVYRKRPKRQDMRQVGGKGPSIPVQPAPMAAGMGSMGAGMGSMGAGEGAMGAGGGAMGASQGFRKGGVVRAANKNGTGTKAVRSNTHGGGVTHKVTKKVTSGDRGKIKGAGCAVRGSRACKIS